MSGNSLETEGLYVDGGSGTSAGSVSSPNSLPETVDGIVGMIDGAVMLSVSSGMLLHNSAVIYSVETSDSHLGAVTYSVGAYAVV